MIATLLLKIEFFLLAGCLFGAALLLFALALRIGLSSLLVHDSLLRRPLGGKYAGPVRLWRWRRWWCSSSSSSSHDLVLLFLFVLVVAVKARSLRLRRLRSLNSRHLDQAFAALAAPADARPWHFLEPRALPESTDSEPWKFQALPDSPLFRPMFQPRQFRLLRARSGRRHPVGLGGHTGR